MLVFRNLYVLLLTGLPLTISAQDTSAITHFEVLAPRPFGYVIGDVIRLELRIAVTKPYRLQKGMLPTPGPMNYWLELRNVNLLEEPDDEETRYQVNLTYQTFYAPLAADLRSIPGFRLTFVARNRSFDITVPRWDFTMSPLRELMTRKVQGQQYMRPDTPPPLIETGHYVAILAALGTGCLGALLYLMYYYAVWPFHVRKARPFARARRTVRAMRGQSADLQGYRRAVRTVHGAFNVTYGGPLFEASIDRFLARRPAFEPLRDDIETFFEMSREAFFSDRAATVLNHYPLDRIEGLCAEMQVAERGNA